MTLMEQAHFKQVLSYKSGRLIGICNSCQAQWLYLKFIAGVDKRGEVGSLRITLTLIWLFYPLAWQRTKCIDSIRITPPVSGTHFIHPTAINTVHYGPHANISTFLVTARTEKSCFGQKWGVTRLQGNYWAYTRGLRKRRREKSIKRGQRSDGIQAFFSLVSCPYMQQTSLTKLITEEKCQYGTESVTGVGFFNLLRANRGMVRNDSGTLWYFKKGRHILPF